MTWLWPVLAVFIVHPLLAGVVGMVLLGLGRHTRPRVAVAAGAMWGLYALYDSGMKLRCCVAASATEGDPAS